MYDFKKDLKKCPFCGGTAYLKRRAGLYGFIGYNIECKECKTRTRLDIVGNGHVKVENGKITGLYTRKDNDVINSLVEKWNSRI